MCTNIKKLFSNSFSEFESAKNVEIMQICFFLNSRNLYFSVVDFGLVHIERGGRGKIKLSYNTRKESGR